MGQEGRLAVNLNNIALSHRQLGDTVKAQELFLLSLENYHAQGDLPGEAMVLGNLGNLSTQMGMMDDALKYHEQALGLQRQVGNPEGVALEHLNIAEWHAKKGDERKALAHADSSLRLATEVGSLKLMRDANQRLSLAHEKLGATAKSLFHLKEFQRLNAEMSTEEASRQMAEPKARIETPA